MIQWKRFIFLLRRFGMPQVSSPYHYYFWFVLQVVNLPKRLFLDRPGKKVIHISNKIHNRFYPFPYTLESKAGVIKNIKEEKQVIGNCFKKMVFPHQKYV